jgi:hypothetical protein
MHKISDKLFTLLIKISYKLPLKWQAKIYSYLMSKALEGQTGKKIPVKIEI